MQYDDRPLSVHDRRLLERNRLHCRNHSCDFRFYTSGYESLPPWWVKVALVKDMLDEGYDGVLWVDSDAVVHDFNRSINDVFADAAKNFFYAADHPSFPPFHTTGWGFK